MPLQMVAASHTYPFRQLYWANVEAALEVVRAAVKSGVSYLGINFPLDYCLDCQSQGTFDGCPVCGGSRIQRIRRVSGYLEDLDYFTAGKKAEVSRRKPNLWSPQAGGR